MPSDATPAIPHRLRYALARWDNGGRPGQPAMRWTRPTWQATLPEHHDLLASLPDVIDRSTVTKRAAGAADGDAPAVQAFVTAMVWGYGPAGYGAFRTARVGWAGENGDKERYNQLAPKHHYYYKSS